jgi:hypothetical protein
VRNHSCGRTYMCTCRRRLALNGSTARG